jgi:photosystem II stability/assembly factor-like uncharacterized protein
MGGRIDDFAVLESDPRTIYAATASGGLWKTTNNGVTWQPLFDGQSTSSIGDVTLAPSNPDIVWAGTGEPNNRQSSSWGDGVFKSTDGGRTWNNMGLRETHHIGRIAVHPRDPDVVYVAALGRLWGPNNERGLFKTTDGGRTWRNVLFLDRDTGVVDVALDVESPETLYAAAYQRRRAAWGFNGGGPASGLYKTTDGGESWIKLSNGLPSGVTGRIGLDIYRGDTRVVYALVEHKEGGIFRSDDKGFSWRRMSAANPRPMYYSKVRVDPRNDQRVWVLGASMHYSEDGGKTFRDDLLRSIHGDHHAMWINPDDSDHLIVGSDGGIHFSYDRGLSWDFVNTIPLGQFYEVAADMGKPYWIYGGLQDNGTWGGPSATWNRLGVTNDDWVRVGGGDGFYVQVDPSDPDVIYAESQDGNIYRFDRRSGESKPIRPQPEDERERYRFNWNSPIFISPHGARALYYGGNRLFKSVDRGETWTATIDLTTSPDRSKMPIMGQAVGPETLSGNDGVSHFGTITTVSESSLKEGVLWVGTDDGCLQVSRDGGATWTNVASRLPGVPRGTYVSRVEPSHALEGAAYVALDGHRGDDFTPYIFYTADHGETWKPVHSNIPVGSTVSVVREHPREPRLLFAGTERGAYVSFDAGARWTLLESNLPMVPVDDILIHPRDNDLILGTHGRSLIVLDDIAPLEQLCRAGFDSPLILFDVREATVFNPSFHKGSLGDKFFVAANPPYGASVAYYLAEDAGEDAQLVISDAEGSAVRTLKGPKKAGLHRVVWDLRYEPPAGGETASSAPAFGLRQGPSVIPGEYTVVLKAGGREAAGKIRVAGDPRISVSLEDRKAQRDALLEAGALTSAVARVESAASALKRKLESAQALIKAPAAPPQALTEALAGAIREVDAVRADLVGRPGGGFSPESMRASLRGRLMMAARTVGAATEAPSARSLADIAAAGKKLRELTDRLNAVIEQGLPRLNTLMAEAGIPHIPAEPPVKW